MGRLVLQPLVGAEVAGRGAPRQILIALYALGRLAEVHTPVAVGIQQLIGVDVAEIDQLVDPIQHFLKIHIPTSPAAQRRFCLVRWSYALYDADLSQRLSHGRGAQRGMGHHPRAWGA